MLFFCYYVGNIVYNYSMNVNKVKIEIDTKIFIRFWLVVIGFGLGAFAIYSARTALLIVFISLFFAVALSSPVNRLVKILPSKSRVLSTAIAYIAVVAFLSAIVFLVIPPIVEQTLKFIQNIPSLLESATQQYGVVSEFINRYHLQDQYNQIIESLQNSVTSVASAAGTNIINGISSIISIITATILILVLTFLMLVESPEWINGLWSLYKNRTRMNHHKNLVHKIYGVVTNYITGQLSVSAIAGLVTGIAVFIASFIFDTPANLAIPGAATVFISSLIPVFGAMIGGFIISFILLLNNLTAAIAFLVFFILYQQIEANYISPKIQSKRINLSPLVILIAVTIGIYLFGVLGGIISIPIAGCIKIFVEEYLINTKSNS